MKRFSLFVAALGILIALSTTRVFAQSNTGVPVRIWGKGITSEDTDSWPNQAVFNLSGTFVPTTPSDTGVRTASVGSYSAWDELTANLGLVNVMPGVLYSVSESSSNVDDRTLFVVPPPGYDVIIEGMYRNAASFGGVAHFRIIPRFEGPPGAAGFASTISGAQVNWRLSLGFLRNGRDAGSLQLADPATGPNWSTLFTPAALSYAATSAEVYVYQPNNILRQIIANQVAVDIVTLNSTSYEIRCYNPNQVQSYVPCTFSGQPFVTYRVEKGTPDAAHANDVTAVVLKISRETRNINDPSQANVPITRRDVMTLQRSGTWPSYQWLKNDWTQEGQTTLVSTAVQGGGTSQNRTESISVKGLGGTVAANLTRSYTLYSSCGEQLTQETLGTNSSRTTNFNYNTDSNSPGSLGYVSSAALPGGGWEAYDYYDNNSPTSVSAGKLYRKYRPFGAAPASVSRNASLGEVTEYAYASDPFGFMGRMTSTTVTVNGTKTSQRTWNYDDTDGDRGDGIVAVSIFDQTATGAGITTINRYYSEDRYDQYTRGMPASIQQPDGLMKAYTYEVGTWDGTTFTQGAAWKGGSRITETIGTADGNGGLTLVNGRSQMNVTIRDVRALPVRQEMYVWTNYVWQLTTWTNFTYNFAGFPVSKISNNGATYTATWDGELKTSETDEAGTTVNYTYDAAGRKATTTRAAAGTIPALLTSYTYDALGSVVQQRIGASGSEQLISFKTYDDATRLSSETPAGLGVTTYAYDVANRTKTTTFADGGTIVEATSIDGRSVSMGGTAKVAEYYTYGAESSGATVGQRWTQVNYGSTGSPRWKKTWVDMVGRPVKGTRPGFSTQPTYLEGATYSTTTGQLIKSTTSNLAPTLYQYDSLGLLNRMGIDTDASETLVIASNDRITDRNIRFEQYNGSWWARTETLAYRDSNQSNSTTTGIVRKRLTGFPSNCLEEIQETDVQGNVTITTKVVDRGNGKATIAKSRTGQVWKEIQEIVNGIKIKESGIDGLATVTAYDALGRQSSVTDARGNTTTFTYIAGTSLLQTVRDATNAAVATNTYDSMGRVISTIDAGGHVTYSSFNVRGQLLRTWGDGAFPVEYGYDSTYGDKTTMTTFRGGNGWNASAWPGTPGNASASPGTGDVTSWAYDPATRLLASKTDAMGRSVTYTYDTAGRMMTRNWARGVTTTYSYSASTGEQTGIIYSDGTPSLSYVFNRVGEMTQVTQGSLVGTFDHCVCGRVSVEYLDPTFFGGRMLSYKMNSTADGTKGRIVGLALTVGVSVEEDVNYAYDPLTDRLASLATSSGGVPSSNHNFRYTYLENANLIGTLAVESSPFVVSRAFETQRDVLTSITTAWSTDVRARYDYITNTLGQRTSVKQSGDAFSDYGDSTFQIFAYDGRSQLTSAIGYLGNDMGQMTQPLPGRNLTFAYDNIGNRQSTNVTPTTAQADNYTSNSLNEIVTKQNHAVQVSGTADAASRVSIGGSGSSASRQGRFWSDQITVPNGSSPWRGPLVTYVGKSGAGANGSDLLRIDSRIGTIPLALQAFTYDYDGNLSSDGVWDYSWDAENRLIAMQTSAPALLAGFPGQRLEFKYDYLGRRIEKLVRTGWNGSSFTTVAMQRRFVYNGWSLIAEYNVVSSPLSLVLARSYTWGLDIATDLQKAGGVGALLQVVDHVSGKTYFAAYDANGNVTALLNSNSGELAAKYEYSPYGEQLSVGGRDASIADQPFRFSTKYTDGETGLVYYGRRYYDPKTGQFPSRDPMEEKGGIHLYAIVWNNPINRWDYLGLCGSPGQPPCQMKPFIVTASRRDPDFNADGYGGDLTLVFDLPTIDPPDDHDDHPRETPGQKAAQDPCDPDTNNSDFLKITGKDVKLGGVTVSGQFGDSENAATTIAFLRANSETFDIAFTAMSQAAIDGRGWEIRPSADFAGGAGATADHVIVFDQSTSNVFGDGRAISPAYTLAHEVGHAADDIFQIVDGQYPGGINNPNSPGGFDWKSPEADFGGNGYNGTSPAVEAFAVRFANQVADEVKRKSGLDIGHLNNYTEYVTDKSVKPCNGTMVPGKK